MKSLARFYLSGRLNRMSGTLEVITGPMFAGKTQTLLARVRLASSRGLRTGLYKPITDTRVASAEVKTHAGDKMAAEWCQPDGSTIDTSLDLIALDEVQFFHPGIVSLLLSCVKSGSSIVVAGLDLTSTGEPFGPMPALMAVADHIEKLTAPCSVCGGVGTRSYRRSASTDTILIGGADFYEPRCLPCFVGV